MNVFSKQRFVGWVLIGLVLLNIVLLGTMWALLLRKPSETPDDAQSFVQQELHLTETQITQFTALRASHLTESKQLLDDIHALKEAITSELFVMSPDTEKVDGFTEQIGTKYAELERLHFQYFLGMREMFAPDQQEQLEGLMRELLQEIKPPPLPSGVRPQSGQFGAPQEAKDACVEKRHGEPCQFVAPHGTVAGTCQMREQLVCVPDNAISGRPPENGG